MGIITGSIAPSKSRGAKHEPTNYPDRKPGRQETATAGPAGRAVLAALLAAPRVAAVRRRIHHLARPGAGPAAGAGDLLPERRVARRPAGPAKDRAGRD